MCVCVCVFVSGARVYSSDSLVLIAYDRRSNIEIQQHFYSHPFSHQLHCCPVVTRKW